MKSSFRKTAKDTAVEAARNLSSHPRAQQTAEREIAQNRVKSIAILAWGAGLAGQFRKPSVYENPKHFYVGGLASGIQ